MTTEQNQERKNRLLNPVSWLMRNNYVTEEPEDNSNFMDYPHYQWQTLPMVVDKDEDEISFGENMNDDLRHLKYLNKLSTKEVENYQKQWLAIKEDLDTTVQVESGSTAAYATDDLRRLNFVVSKKSVIQPSTRKTIKINTINYIGVNCISAAKQNELNHELENSSIEMNILHPTTRLPQGHTAQNRVTEDNNFEHSYILSINYNTILNDRLRKMRIICASNNPYDHKLLSEIINILYQSGDTSILTTDVQKINIVTNQKSLDESRLGQNRLVNTFKAFIQIQQAKYAYSNPYFFFLKTNTTGEERLNTEIPLETDRGVPFPTGNLDAVISLIIVQLLLANVVRQIANGNLLQMRNRHGWFLPDAPIFIENLLVQRALITSQSDPPLDNVSILRQNVAMGIDQSNQSNQNSQPIDNTILEITDNLFTQNAEVVSAYDGKPYQEIGYVRTLGSNILESDDPDQEMSPYGSPNPRIEFFYNVFTRQNLNPPTYNVFLPYDSPDTKDRIYLPGSQHDMFQQYNNIIIDIRRTDQLRNRILSQIIGPRINELQSQTSDDDILSSWFEKINSDQTELTSRAPPGESWQWWLTTDPNVTPYPQCCTSVFILELFIAIAENSFDDNWNVTGNSIGEYVADLVVEAANPRGQPNYEPTIRLAAILDREAGGLDGAWRSIISGDSDFYPNQISNIVQEISSPVAAQTTQEEIEQAAQAARDRIAASMKDDPTEQYIDKLDKIEELCGLCASNPIDINMIHASSGHADSSKDSIQHHYVCNECFQQLGGVDDADCPLDRKQVIAIERTNIAKLKLALFDAVLNANPAQLEQIDTAITNNNANDYGIVISDLKNALQQQKANNVISGVGENRSVEDEIKFIIKQALESKTTKNKFLFASRSKRHRTKRHHSHKNSGKLSRRSGKKSGKRSRRSGKKSGKRSRRSGKKSHKKSRKKSHKKSRKKSHKKSRKKSGKRSHRSGKKSGKRSRRSGKKSRKKSHKR